MAEQPIDLSGQVLELFSRAPGGAIVSTGWTGLEALHGECDLAVRSDGTVSATLDGDETLWVTWSTGYSMGGYSLDTTGTQRTWSFDAASRVEETDVQYSATADTVFSFYVGMQIDDIETTGVNVVAGTGALAMPCPARSAAFDSAGHLWGVYKSELCRDGEITHLADTLDHPRLAVDGHMSIVIAPEDAGMGSMVLATFR